MRFQFFILLTMLLIVGVVSTALAQHGGKAEPKRIEFARGTSSTTIKDSIRRTTEAEYVFGARQGQHITVALVSAPPKSALVRLRNGDGVDSKLEYDGTNWSGVAPASGDYLITVVAADRAPQKISYTLRLAIK